MPKKSMGRKVGQMGKRYGKPKINLKKETRICDVPGCSEIHYAMGYCRSHYSIYLRTGSPVRKNIKNKGKTCWIEGCDNDAVVKGCCPKHNYRIKQNGDPNIVHNNKGEKNGNWKGGKEGYKNHNLMKKNRLIRLAEVKGLCEACKTGRAKYAYHKDRDRDNVALENLLMLCPSCFQKTIEKRQSEKKAEYGNYSLKKLSELTKISMYSLKRYFEDKNLDPAKREFIEMKIHEVNG